MKTIMFFIVLFLASCSSKDEQFCTCLSAGAELNEYTQQFFDKTPSTEEKERAHELKGTKVSACKGYQMMRGDVMREKKMECEK